MRTFDTAGVGIERGGVSPLETHRLLNEVERVEGDVAPFGVCKHASGIEVTGGEKGLIAQHLFEMRDMPLAIDAVARESAADVVVEPATGHRLEGDGDGVTRLVVVELE